MDKCSHIVSLRSLFFSCEAAQRTLYPCHRNSCLPFTVGAQADTFKSSGITKASIHRILGNRTSAQILTAIIETISISVVGQFSWTAIENQPVHLFKRRISNGVKRRGSSRLMSLPFALSKPFKVSIIDNCYFALSKWDMLHGAEILA